MWADAMERQENIRDGVSIVVQLNPASSNAMRCGTGSKHLFRKLTACDKLRCHTFEKTCNAVVLRIIQRAFRGIQKSDQMIIEQPVGKHYRTEKCHGLIKWLD